MVQMCSLLLSDKAPLNAEAFLQQWNSASGDWPKNPIIETDTGVTKVNFGNRTLFIAAMPAPMPDAKIDENHPHPLWDTAGEELPNHKSHWVVTVSDSENSDLEHARLLTHAVRCVFRSHPSAMGLMWGSHAHLVSSENFLSLASAVDFGGTPVALWITFFFDWHPDNQRAEDRWE